MTAPPLALVADEPAEAGPGLEAAPLPEEPPEVEAPPRVEPSEPRASTRFRVYSELELDGLPRPSWLIDHHLPWAGLSVLYGEPGAGKSFLALDWALCVATGRNWLGHAVLWSPVVYVAAEGGRGVVPRVQAWRDGHEAAREPSDSAFFLFEAPNLLDLTDASAFAQALRDEKIPGRPGLVVLDTMARCMVGGEENSAKDVGLVIAQADQIRTLLNCAVLIVHHSGKDGRSERGSSALRGAADAMFSLKNEDGPILLTCERHKDAELIKPQTLRLGKQSESLIITAAEHAPEPEGLTPSQQKALRALALHFEGSKCCIGEWASVTAIPKSTLHLAASRLKRMGYVAQEKRTYTITPAGRTSLQLSNEAPSAL